MSEEVKEGERRRKRRRRRRITGGERALALVKYAMYVVG